MIKYIAREKPTKTTKSQNSLDNFEGALEIYVRPWIVEDSRNSLNESITSAKVLGFLQDIKILFLCL